MKLYHGTNQDITTIDPSLGMRHKDFGQGFYLTPEYDTASRMAQKRARLFGGTPTIIEYEFDEPLQQQSVIKLTQSIELWNCS